ncbi:uncharacterized protein LOC131256763 isoform X2 [Magnolia sinica]|uniref:uncharacterized protein LOC131256763 isoform X2 n=1 Tax=Magnolia sinica TaxID=86752 RepID=UPI00265B4407|nr:uncharacterized protein LOC131256763 isoform X2 [Magnolia sinica]
MDDNSLESQVSSQSCQRADLDLLDESRIEEAEQEELVKEDEKLDEELKLENLQDESHVQETGQELSVKTDDDLDKEPKLGMEFTSEEDAYEFYNKYAGKVGFSVRRAWIRRSDDGIITTRIFCCCKEGKKREDKRTDQVKYHRPATRTDCLARMIIRLQKNGKYSVTKFVAEHNHEVLTPSEAHLLRSQKALTNTLEKRYDHLCRKFIKIAAMAADCDEAFKFVDSYLEKLNVEVMECIKRVKGPALMTSHAIDGSVDTGIVCHEPTDNEVTIVNSVGSQNVSGIRVPPTVGSSCFTLKYPLYKEVKKRSRTESTQSRTNKEKNESAQAPNIIHPPLFPHPHYPVAFPPLAQFNQGPHVIILSPFGLPSGSHAGPDHPMIKSYTPGPSGSINAPLAHCCIAGPSGFTYAPFPACGQQPSINLSQQNPSNNPQLPKLHQDSSKGNTVPSQSYSPPSDDNESVRSED